MCFEDVLENYLSRSGLHYWQEGKIDDHEEEEAVDHRLQSTGNEDVVFKVLKKSNECRDQNVVDKQRNSCCKISGNED